MQAIRGDICRRIHVPVPVVIESNAGTLQATEAVALPDHNSTVASTPGLTVSALAPEPTVSAEATAEGTDGVDATVAIPPPPAALEPPRFTYITPPPSEGLGVHHSVPPRPMKFNARVLVTFGMKELEADKVDHLFARRLRVLCGRRKKAATLLGGAWCEELDGGNPMEDRGCLLNTARRALMAQSLLDIAGGAGCRSTITKLGEINYHRPQEEFNGKMYPEQEECTALYLCVLQPTRCSENDIADFDLKWDTFLARVNGLHVGPTLNAPHDEALEACQAAADAVREVLAPKTEAANNDEPVDVVAQVEAVAVEAAEASAEPTADMPATEAPVQAVAGRVPVGSITADESAQSLAERKVSGEGVESGEGGEGEPGEDGQVNEEGKEDGELGEAKANAAADDTKSASQQSSALVLRTLDKPAVPSVLLCPFPLPKNMAADAIKAQEVRAL